jgi:hypothetical protein
MAVGSQLKTAAERRDEFSPAFQGREHRTLTASLTRRGIFPFRAFPALKGRVKFKRRGRGFELTTAYSAS